MNVGQVFGKRAWIAIALTIVAGSMGLGFAIASMSSSTPPRPGSAIDRRPPLQGFRPIETTGSSTSESKTAPAQTIYPPCNSPTPCNQDALDAVLEGAARIAGHRYYTAGKIDTEANTATVYLVTGTPQGIIDEIEARYPNVEVVHSAPHNLYALNTLSDEIAADVPELKALGVVVRSISKTSDGRLVVGVANNLEASTAILESRYGEGWVRVVKADGIILF